MTSLTEAQQPAAERLLDLVGPLRLRYCPLLPTARQEAFLRLPQLEVLFGGAVGGGKSIALLMAALMYCDVPGYAALLLRRSLTEFALPGGLLEIAANWLGPTPAVWVAEQRAWRFPGPGPAGSGGASLVFGFLDNPTDLGRYAGSSFSFVGFDELVRFEQQQYTSMFRALRQPDQQTAPLPPAADGTRLADVPLRARATSNPGGPNHDWVKRYFVDPLTRRDGTIFLPSRLTDNPHLDTDAYTASLASMPTTIRERLLHGNWDIPDEGTLFQRDWIPLINKTDLPALTRSVRYWDLAATAPSAAAPDPDWTVGLRLDYHHPTRTFTISDIIRTRKPPGTIEGIVAATAQRDGRPVPIKIEQEPGGSGSAQIRHYARDVLRGYSVRGHRVTDPKDVRAHPVAAAAENGMLNILPNPHLHDFLDELCSFPNAPHDDCVDALSGAYNTIDTTSGTARISRPTGRITLTTTRRTAASLARELEHQQRADAELTARYGLPVYDPRSWHT